MYDPCTHNPRPRTEKEKDQLVKDILALAEKKQAELNTKKK